MRALCCTPPLPSSAVLAAMTMRLLGAGDCEDMGCERVQTAAILRTVRMIVEDRVDLSCHSIQSAHQFCHISSPSPVIPRRSVGQNGIFNFPRSRLFVTDPNGCPMDHFRAMPSAPPSQSVWRRSQCQRAHAEYSAGCRCAPAERYCRRVHGSIASGLLWIRAKEIRHPPGLKRTVACKPVGDP